MIRPSGNMSRKPRLHLARVLGVVPNRHSPELDRAAAGAIHDARAIDVARNPILRAWRNALETTGEIAAPQLLLELALRSGRLPQTDTVTGACHLVSLRTLTAITAHDLDRVQGEPQLIVTTGRELFHPLSGTRPHRLPPQQWAVVAGNAVLTHLDSRQSAQTQVTLQTRNVLLCVQSTGTEGEHALREACAAVVAFNGGRAML